MSIMGHVEGSLAIVLTFGHRLTEIPPAILLVNVVEYILRRSHIKNSMIRPELTDVISFTSALIIICPKSREPDVIREQY